jgi:hypothetical protein
MPVVRDLSCFELVDAIKQLLDKDRNIRVVGVEENLYRD